MERGLLDAVVKEVWASPGSAATRDGNAGEPSPLPGPTASEGLLSGSRLFSGTFVPRVGGPGPCPSRPCLPPATRGLASKRVSLRLHVCPGVAHQGQQGWDCRPAPQEGRPGRTGGGRGRGRSQEGRWAGWAPAHGGSEGRWVKEPVRDD